VVRLTRRRLFVSGFAIVGATTIALSSERAAATLVVADAESDKRLFEIPIDEGDEVILAYTHSVQKTPVRDIYVVEDQQLRADRSVFHSFGAGLPTENVEQTEEGYVVDGSGQYDKLHLVPGDIARHELVVSDHQYDLADAADGPVVLFVTDRTCVGRAT
jgi:hypothetical protein